MGFDVLYDSSLALVRSACPSADPKAFRHASIRIARVEAQISLTIITAREGFTPPGSKTVGKMLIQKNN
jgi:hypothetical protein